MLTYPTEIASGCSFFHFLKSLTVIESESEQPASKSGINTFFCGLIIAAVSAIKCTPQNKIVLLSTFAACLDRPKESPTKSATS